MQAENRVYTILMICMRLNIAYAVDLLARYSNKESRVALSNCLTQLLQYCYRTRICDWLLVTARPTSRRTATPTELVIARHPVHHERTKNVPIIIL